MKPKQYTADELLEIIKKKGIVKCKLTENLYEIPKGTILWFGTNKRFISSYAENTGNINEQFGYNFNCERCDYWHEEYRGKFIILEYSDKQKANSKKVNK